MDCAISVTRVNPAIVSAGVREQLTQTDKGAILLGDFVDRDSAAGDILHAYKLDLCSPQLRDNRIWSLLRPAVGISQRRDTKPVAKLVDLRTREGHRGRAIAPECN